MSYWQPIICVAACNPNFQDSTLDRPPDCRKTTNKRQTPDSRIPPFRAAAVYRRPLQTLRLSARSTYATSPSRATTKFTVGAQPTEPHDDDRSSTAWRRIGCGGGPSVPSGTKTGKLPKNGFIGKVPVRNPPEKPYFSVCPARSSARMSQSELVGAGLRAGTTTWRFSKSEGFGFFRLRNPH
jgi:hypothetical protein